MTNKYGAKPFYLGRETGKRTVSKQQPTDDFFASEFEYEVYQELLRWVPKELIERQYKVMIKPKTFRYPAMYWTADFAILDLRTNLDSTFKKPFALIEAKGFVTNDFKIRIKLLEYIQPLLYSRLVIIKPGDANQSIDSSRLRTDNLKTLRVAIDRLVPLINHHNYNKKESD
jgi:hypothetical protein